MEKKIDIVKLEIEIISSEIVFERVHGTTVQRIQKNPSYISLDYSSLEIVWNTQPFHILKLNFNL
jgi:hypothetical protein